MRQQDGRSALVDRAPGAASVQRQADAGGPGKRTLVDQSYAPVQRREAAGAVDDPAGQIHAAAARGVAGAGSPLPHLDTIQRAFGRHDVSGVSSHVGGAAAAACQDMGAQAYASGTNVAFAQTPDLHTAAHEAAHVVQQRDGVQLKAGVGIAGDSYERHADAVADRVVAGQSAEALLDAHAGSAETAGQAAVQRQGHPPVPSGGGSSVEQLIRLLNTPDPIAGVGDFVGAFRLLNGLSMTDMLATINAAADRGYFDLLLDHSAAAGTFNRARLMSALYAVQLARAPAGVNNDLLSRAGRELDQIPRDQQLHVFEYILNRRGSNVAVTTLMEGVVAMREGEAAGAVGAPGAAAAAGAGTVPAGPAGAAMSGPSPVEPGPWAPPGQQPIPFYIGNEAHRAIAQEYRGAHPGDTVQANTFPLSSMLRTLTAMGRRNNAGALNETEHGLMPDIANLTRLHLYEIKPVAAQALGAAKAAMYLGLFTRAGVAMALGPTGEPGTSGGVPAPGGVYMFWSPEPGVIVYQYRRGRLVPVPVPAPEREPSRERRWRLELQPLTPQQQQQVATTTFATAMLLLMMILLAPVGA